MAPKMEVRDKTFTAARRQGGKAVESQLKTDNVRGVSRAWNKIRRVARVAGWVKVTVRYGHDTLILTWKLTKNPTKTVRCTSFYILYIHMGNAAKICKNALASLRYSSVSRPGRTCGIAAAWKSHEDLVKTSAGSINTTQHFEDLWSFFHRFQDTECEKFDWSSSLAGVENKKVDENCSARTCESIRLWLWCGLSKVAILCPKIKRETPTLLMFFLWCKAAAIFDFFWVNRTTRFATVLGDSTWKNSECQYSE